MVLNAFELSTAEATARDYYNSADADRFYASIWGGEDIHIGLYESPDDPIRAASQRTVERMAALVDHRRGRMRVLDLGSGYGGAARWLAANLCCRVVGLNLSEAQNRRARRLTGEQGLDSLVDIVDGSFEEIPERDASFEVVWSQDAMLHSGNRGRVLHEVARVLKPGGDFVFTDPMQADACPPGVLAPILARIHLDSLASPAFYRARAEALGLHEVGFEDLTPHLVQHYRRVLQETERRAADKLDDVSAAYLARMTEGLRHWIAGGERGHLVWGIFHFRRD
jgi:sarcosine/dimethylglycine N-methyltransferase